MYRIYFYYCTKLSIIKNKEILGHKFNFCHFKYNGIKHLFEKNLGHKTDIYKLFLIFKKQFLNT